MIKNARLSDDGVYRYMLSREWNSRNPMCAFIMLNPSTADASQDDPTIRKCIGFANANDFGGIVVVNLYAYRATSPMELKRRIADYTKWQETDRRIRTMPVDPVGYGNDAAILTAVGLFGVEMIVCAWGANARGHKRVSDVMNLLGSRHLHALKMLPGHVPAHPLMLPYASQPVRFR